MTGEDKNFVVVGPIFTIGHHSMIHIKHGTNNTRFEAKGNDLPGEVGWDFEGLETRISVAGGVLVGYQKGLGLGDIALNGASEVEE